MVVQFYMHESNQPYWVQHTAWLSWQWCAQYEEGGGKPTLQPHGLNLICWNR